MTDKVQVDRAYLEGLERLQEACVSCARHAEIDKILLAIPPKPEELIEMEGWKASVVRVYNYGIQWWRGDMRIFGPKRTTEAEAIRAGNAMLREIAMKVKP